MTNKPEPAAEPRPSEPFELLKQIFHVMGFTQWSHLPLRQRNEWINLEEHVRLTLAAAPAPVLARPIDGKFSMKYGVSGGHIVNTVSGEVIPEDEPLFLLRGRDHNALAAINAYQEACEKDGCNDLHLAGAQQVREKFCQFAAEHSERMKQPGITRHLKLDAAPAPPEPRDVLRGETEEEEK